MGVVSASTAAAPNSSGVQPTRTRAATQPVVGVIGLGFVAVVVAVFAVGVGPMRSLQSLGPVMVYALPVIAVVGVWWEGRPFRGLGRPLGGALDTVLAVASGLGLLIIGQAIVGRSDISHLLDVLPPPAPPETPPPAGTPAFTSYPWTFVLGGAVFVAMLQLTFVNGRWPLRRLSAVPSGFAALLLAWVVGLGTYLLLADWDAIVPPAAQTALGLGNPGGPANALELLDVLTWIAAWQMIVFVALGGQPVARIQNEALRLVVANVAVVALGWLSFVFAKSVLDWTIPTIAGVGGSVIAAALIAGLVFEGWPARTLGAGGAAAGTVLTIAVLAAALFLLLRVLGNATGDWNPRDPVELWITLTTFNFVSAPVVLWATVFGRWPAPSPAPN